MRSIDFDINKAASNGPLSTNTITEAAARFLDRPALGALTLLVGLLSACSGEFQAEELQTIDEAITGGTLITGAADNPLGAADATLRISTGPCTGTKVSSKRILTAQHCIPGVVVGSDIRVTNSVSGAFPATPLKITAIHRYPTQPANFDSGHWVDAALIDVDKTLPGPSIGVRTTLVGEMEKGTGIGYGCDAEDPSHDGKKQHGVFHTQRWLHSANPADAGYVHALGTDVLCPGDSGGPLYSKVSADTWQVAGIAACSSYATGGSESCFTRLDPIANWIANPEVNNFTDNATGRFLNRKGNNCITGSASPSLNYCGSASTVGSSQSWLLRVSGSGFKMVSIANGTCLVSSPDGTQVIQQADCSGNKGKWTFINPVTLDGFQYYHMRNMAAAKCLGTAAPGDVNEGSLLTLKSCSSGVADDQLFTMVKN
jgi:V8-like Glu-specific endopeptidase